MVSNSSLPSLILADAHRVFVAGLAKLLQDDFRVVGLAYDGRALIEMAQQLHPNIILTSLAMPLMNGIEAMHRIKRSIPSMSIVCMSGVADDDIVRECFQKGASGFIPKTASTAELVLGLKRVLQGDIYLSDRLPQAAKLFSQPATEAPREEKDRHLTERQIEVLQLLAEGKTMKEVAAVLNLTTRTVAFHKYRMMENLNLNTDAQVVQYALQHRVVFS